MGGMGTEDWRDGRFWGYRYMGGGGERDFIAKRRAREIEKDWRNSKEVTGGSMDWGIVGVKLEGQESFKELFGELEI